MVLEPEAKNTAAAVLLGALLALRQDPDAVVVAAPSDHVVEDEAAFDSALRVGVEAACKHRFALLGVTPRQANTGYGYIQCGAAVDGVCGTVFSVSRFVEKPDEAAATRYLEAGNYLWNSGIFVLHARALVGEFAAREPDLLECVGAALDLATPEPPCLRLDAHEFARAKPISLDHAIMERTRKAVVIPLDAGWCDLGTWNALADLVPPDGRGNQALGDAILENTDGCFVQSERALTAMLGVRNLVVVNTKDALLVADKSRIGDISLLSKRMEREGRAIGNDRIRSYRPWGFFDCLQGGDGFQVKRLHVDPGAKLSLQRHKYRSEHWVVVKGQARVTIGDEVRDLVVNESAFIGAGQWHRLENSSKDVLEIIEVQLGPYLGEDDIERREDIYNRTLRAQKRGQERVSRASSGKRL